MPYSYGGSSSSGGGGYSYTPSSTSSATGLSQEELKRIAQQRADSRQDQGGGILGLLGNAWEGVTGMVGGIGGLIAAGVHDVGRGVAQAVPGRQDWGVIADSPEDQYRVDDVGKGIVGFTDEGFHPLDESSLLGSIYHRWEPFLPGGTPAQEGWEGLYEDPMGAVLDVASVASLGAGAAAKGAGAAAKAGGLADDVARAAGKLAQAGVRGRTANAAALRSVLDDAGKLTPFQGAMLPKATHVLREGEGLVPSAQAFNPLYRAVAEPIKKSRLLSRSVDDLSREANELRTLAQVEPGVSTKARSNAKLLDDTIADMKAKGVERVARPGIVRTMTKYQAARDVLSLSERFYNRRDAMTKAEVGAVERTLSEMVDSGMTLEAAKTRLSHVLQRLDVDVEDATVPDVIGLQDLTGLEGNVPLALGQVDEVAEAAGAGAVATVTREAVQVAPDSDIAIRTEAIRTKINEFVDDLETNRVERMETGWDVDAEIDAARRLERQLDDGLLRMSDDATKPEYRLVDEMRLMDTERVAGVADEAGNGFLTSTLTPRSMLSRNYRSLQGKYGMQWSDEAGDYVDGPALNDIDDALHASNQPAPTYFPHIDANKLKGTDWFRSRQKVGANIYARDPHNKQMKLALLRDGSWSKDPIEVLKRRGSRAVRESETYHTWKTITERYGLALDDPSAVPTGYSLVAPDILHANYRVRQSFLNKIDDNLTAGMNRDSAVARALKETLDAQREAIAKLKDTDSVKFYAVPDSVLKNLDATAKWSPAFGGKGVQLYYDTAMNAWRGLALTASPRWVVNNVLGNIAFSLMQGVKVADVSRIAAENFRAMLAERSALFGPKGLRPASLAGQIENLPGAELRGKGFFTNRLENYSPHLPTGAEAMPGAAALEKLRASRAGTRMRNMGQAVKRFNGTIEESFRAASFLTAAEKTLGRGAVKRSVNSFSNAQKRIADIMRDGFDETPAGLARMEMALRDVNTFFGAYGRMTPFERHVVRRFIFPFWGFYRHSTSLMMRFPWEYPGRAHVLESLERVNEDMLTEYGPLPEWMRSPMPLGPPGGSVPILSGAGANPFAGPGEGVEGVTQMLSPVLKTVLEQATGRNAFTGQEFTDRDTFTPFGSDQGYDLNTGEPVDKVAPGVLQALASQIPQFDMVRDLVAGGNTYDTASLLDALQQRMGDVGEASPIDKETGQPYYGVTAGDQLAKMLGMNVFEYDLPAYQERLSEDQVAVLREYLARQAAGAA